VIRFPRFDAGGGSRLSFNDHAGLSWNSADGRLKFSGKGAAWRLEELHRCYYDRMTPNAISILRDPPRCAHLVFPCTDDRSIVDAITIFASAGLENEEAVVLVATEDHCTRVIARLEGEGFNTRALQRSNQLICAKASDTLSRFMVNGAPDEALFRDAVTEIVTRAKSSGVTGQPRNVRAFGEMVSLLWRVDVAVAARLEELWNNVIEEHQLALLCTYSLDGTHSHGALPECLVGAHSHDLATCTS
jgi:MEDS: MEthanogen/methylotroph, DcmR Sensory domain